MLKIALAASVAAILVSSPAFAETAEEYTKTFQTEPTMPIALAGVWDPAYTPRDRDLEKRAKGARVTDHNIPRRSHSTWDPAISPRDRSELQWSNGTGTAVSSHNVPTTYIPDWDPAKTPRDRFLDRR
jgi:hypothetical protein